MRVEYLSRFDRSFKKLGSVLQSDIREALELFLDCLVKGVRPQGLGLRRLRGSFWEIRVGLNYRILFELKGDCVTFIIVGDHDDIRRFLKNL